MHLLFETKYLKARHKKCGSVPKKCSFLQTYRISCLAIRCLVYSTNKYFRVVP